MKKLQLIKNDIYDVDESFVSLQIAIAVYST